MQCEKNQMLMLLVEKLGIFCSQQELPRSKSDPMLSKKIIIDPNQYSKGLSKSLPGKYSKKFVLKVKLLPPSIYPPRKIA